MPNTREKLIESICSTEYGNSSLIGNNFQKGFIEKIADHLLASSFIEELQNEAYDLGVDSALHNHFGLSWEDAAGLRKEIKSLQEATRWIPVAERLPEPGTEVLVYTKHPHSPKMEIGVFTYYPEMYQPHWQYVTHWMPLPQPPKGE